MEEVKLFGITPRGAHYMVNMQTKNDETLKNLEELLTKPKIREQLDAYAYDLDLKKSRVRYLSGILEDGVTHFTLELCKMPEEPKDLEKGIYVSEVDSLRAIEEKKEELYASEVCLCGAIKAKRPESKIKEIFREGQRTKIELIKLETKEK